MRRACLAMLLAGCGHAAPAPPAARPAPRAVALPADAAPPPDAPVPLEQDLPRLAMRAAAMFQAWQHALEGAGEDCAAAAAAMTAVAGQYADVIAANRRVVAAGPDRVAALKQALAAHETELDAAASAVVHSPAMAKCGSSPEFVKALDRFEGVEP